jgi:hypothetical protein
VLSCDSSAALPPNSENAIFGPRRGINAIRCWPSAKSQMLVPAIVVRRCDPSFVGCQCDHHRLGAIRELVCSERSARRGVPHSNRVVGIARHQPLSVMQERQTVNSSNVPFECQQFLTCLDVPDLGVAGSPTSVASRLPSGLKARTWTPSGTAPERLGLGTLITRV